MPRDGLQQYAPPAGTHGITNYTVESGRYNTFVDDVSADQNNPRPVVAGGTGATNAADALQIMKGDTAYQVITNYDADPFVSGSFYSAAGATGAPVAGHAFAGICYSSDTATVPPAYPAQQNMVIEARDQGDTSNPGRKYVREKRAGVWSAWKADGLTNVGGVGGSVGVGDATADMFFGVTGTAPSSSFIVNSKADVSGTNWLQVSKAGAVTLNSLTVTNNAAISGTFNATGAATFSGTLNVTGTLTASGNITAATATITGNATVGGNATVSGILQSSRLNLNASGVNAIKVDVAGNTIISGGSLGTYFQDGANTVNWVSITPPGNVTIPTSLTIAGMPCYGGIPSVNVGNGYTTVAADAQKHIWATGGVTINGGLYPVGTCISFLAWGGNLVIANTENQYSFVNGGTVTGARTLAYGGMATAIRFAAGYWAISGNGLT